MTAYVFRPSRGGEKSRLWSGRIRLPGWAVMKTFPLQVTDKRVAQQKLAAMVKELENEEVGNVLPKRMRDASLRPIADHLAGFLADVEAKGRAVKTLAAYRFGIPKVCQNCGWRFLGDISGHSFTTWRAGAGVSGKYSNDLLGYFSSFVSWLVRQGLLTADPLRDVERVRITPGLGYRRALTSEELQRLLSSVPVRRATVYLVAAKTGLRRHELNRLRWSDFDLDGVDAFVFAPAAISKGRKAVRLPLAGDVASALREFRGDALPFEWAFWGKVPNMETFYRDLARVKIARLDEYGRRVDFHALRHTLCTQLHLQGVSLREAQELMRHSDVKLTMKTYTDAMQLPLAASIARLPSYTMPAAIVKCDAQIDAHNQAVSGLFESLPDATGHLLAIGDSSASVAVRRTTTFPDSSGRVGKMVDPTRFELKKGESEGSVKVRVAQSGEQETHK